MAITATELNAVNAAALAYLTAVKALTDAGVAGNGVLFVPADLSLDAAAKPNQSERSSTVGTLAGTAGVWTSFNQVVATALVDDAKFPIQIPGGAGGQLVPLVWFVSNQARQLVFT